MSGHKRAFVRLSRNEYERLRDAAEDNRLASSTALEPTPAQTTTLISETSSAIWQDLERAQTRQRDLEDVVGRFDRQVYQIEKATGQALMRQRSELAEQMHGAAGDLYRSVDELIRRQDQTFREEVARVQKETHTLYAAYDAQQQDWKRLKDGHTNLVEDALSWLESAKAVRNFINDRYPHELLAPQALERACQGLSLATDNLRNGVGEAALVSAQQAYLRLSDLRLDLERLDGERQILLRGLSEKLRELNARALSARQIPAVDLDGNELGVPLEVDFWTNGGLSQLLGDINSLLVILDEPLDAASLNQIHQTLPEMEERLSGLVEQARLAVINSQLRFDIAEVVVSALAEQGFALEEGAYSAGDAREGYCVKLKNLEGGEVEVHIAPRPGEELENDLHLLSLDAEARTKHELRVRMKELMRSLSWHGLDVGGMQENKTSMPSTATGAVKMRRTARLGG